LEEIASDIKMLLSSDPT